MDDRNNTLLFLSEIARGQTPQQAEQTVRPSQPSVQTPESPLLMLSELARGQRLQPRVQQPATPTQAPTQTPTQAPAVSPLSSAPPRRSAEPDEEQDSALYLTPEVREAFGDNLPTIANTGVLTPEMEEEDSWIAGGWSDWWNGRPTLYNDTLGEEGFDVNAIREGLYRFRLARERARQRREGIILGVQEDQELRDRLSNEAHDEVREIIDRNRDKTSAIWIDSDPDGTTRRIQDGSFSVLNAWWQPYSHTITRPKRVVLPDGRERWENETGTIYDRQGAWGYLNWFFQPSIGNLFATATAAGQEIEGREERETGQDVGTDIPVLNVLNDIWRGYGTYEHLDNIRSGEELVAYSRQIGEALPDWMLPTALDEGSKFWIRKLGFAEDARDIQVLADTAQGIGVSLAVALVDPDLFFIPAVLTGGLAKLPKMARVARDSARMFRTEAAALRAVRRLEDLEQTMEATADAARASFPPTPGGDFVSEFPGRRRPVGTQAPTPVGDPPDPVFPGLYENVQAEVNAARNDLPAAERELLDASVRSTAAYSGVLHASTEGVVQKAFRAEDAYNRQLDELRGDIEASRTLDADAQANMRQQAAALRQQAATLRQRARNNPQQAAQMRRQAGQYIRRAQGLEGRANFQAQPLPNIVGAPPGARMPQPSFNNVPLRNVVHDRAERIMRRTTLARLDYDRLSQRQLADQYILRDLEFYLEVLEDQAITPVGQVIRGIEPDAARQQQLANDLKQAFQRVVKARLDMAEAATDQAKVTANSALLKAEASFNTATRTILKEMGESGVSAFRILVDDARKASEISNNALAHLFQQIKRAEDAGTINRVGFVGAGATPAQQAEGVTGLHRGFRERIDQAFNSKYTQNRKVKDRRKASILLRAYRDAFQNLGDSYGNLGRALQAKVNVAGGLSRSTVRAALVRDVQFNADGTVVLLQDDALEMIDRLETLLGQDAYNAARVSHPLIAALEKARAPNFTPMTLKPNYLEDAASQIAAVTKRVVAQPYAIALAGERLRKELKVTQTIFGGKYPAIQNIYTTFSRIMRTAEAVINPAKAKLGTDNEVMLQIGKGAQDTLRRGFVDLERYLEEAFEFAQETGTAPARAVREAVVRFVEGDDAVVRIRGVDEDVSVPAPKSSLLYAGTEGTLWQQARHFLTSADKEALDGILDALSRVWVPSSGVEIGKLQGADKSRGIEASLSSRLKAAAARVLDEPGVQTFEQFMQRMRTETIKVLSDGAVSGRVIDDLKMNPETTRAYGLAAQAVLQGATLSRMSRRIAAEMYGFTPKVAEALIHIADGVPFNAKANFQEAIELANRLGMPVPVRKVLEQVGEEVEAGFVMVRGNGTTEAALIPRQFLKAVDDLMRDVVKQTEAYHRENKNFLQRYVTGPFVTMMRLIRQSITTGLFSHSPRYLTAMLSGNVNQLIVDPVAGGFDVAVKNVSQMANAMATSAYQKVYGEMQSLLTPNMNRRLTTISNTLNQIRTNIAARRGVPVNQVLPSAAGTLMNRHVGNFFDSTRAPDVMPVRLSDGSTVTMGYLREEALNQGVLSTYASNELMELLQRSSQKVFNRNIYAPGGVIRAAYRGFKKGAVGQEVGAHIGKVLSAYTQAPIKSLQKRGSIIADFADGIEQRQRAALFLDMVVNQGRSVEDAGSAVRSALYDWGHAMTEVEAEIFNNLVLFWRYYKVSMGQTIRLLSAGLLRGYDGELPTSLRKLGGLGSEAMAYKTPTGRQRIIGTGYQGAREFGNQLTQMSTDNESDLNFSQRYPWWTKSRGTPNLLNAPMTEAEAVAIEDVMGRRVTHMTRTMPLLTTLDNTAMLLGFTAGLLRLVYAAGELVTSGDTGAFGSRANIEAQGFLRGMVDRAPPFTKEALEGVVDAYLKPPETEFAPLPPRLRPSEDLFLRTLGFDNFSMAGTALSEGDPEGTRRYEAGLVALLRVLPIVGNEMPYWLDPLLIAPHIAEARVEQDAAMRRARILGEEIKFLFTQYTGIGKEYYSNPKATLEFENRQLQHGQINRIRRLERRRYAQD